MGVVEVDPPLGRGPAHFDVFEILPGAEEGVEPLDRVRRIGVRVGQPPDEEDLVRDHAARGDSQALGRHGDRRAPRTEREVQEPRPGTGQRVDIDVVRDVDPTADHGDSSLSGALAPVEVGQP